MVEDLSERELVGWPQGSLDGLHFLETGTRVAVPPILSTGALREGNLIDGGLY